MNEIKNLPTILPKVGDYVVKNNYNTFGREYDSTPVLKLNRITHMLGRKGGFSHWVFNKSYRMKPDDFKIIDEIEANRILRIWEDSINLSPVTNDNVNTKCVREDNGNPKVTYNGTHGWRKPLFSFRIKSPNGGYQAYECPECGNVHIGKSIIKDELQDEILLITL